MQRLWILGALVFTLAAAPAAYAHDTPDHKLVVGLQDDDDDVEDLPPSRLRQARCPICVQPVLVNYGVVYNTCPVYFCSDDCSESFVATPVRYVPWANCQLFATQQFYQPTCALCPQPIARNQFCNVGGTRVSFCSSGCRSQVTSLEPREAVQKVFSKTTFTKRFKKKVVNVD